VGDVAKLLSSLSGAARRIVEVLAAADGPLSYEVLRHILRATEEDMIEALAEGVRSGLVRSVQGPPPTYELAPDLARRVQDAIGGERVERLRRQVAGARKRVHGPE